MHLLLKMLVIENSFRNKSFDLIFVLITRLNLINHKYNFLSYRFSTTTKTFDDAKTTCKDVGGQISEPKSKAVNDELADEALNFNGGNSINHWLGVSDKISEGTWVYVSNGQAIPFDIPWYPGLPDGGSSKNCLLMSPSSNPAYHRTWHDWSCSDQLYFICEFSMTQTNTTTIVPINLQ